MKRAEPAGRVQMLNMLGFMLVLLMTFTGQKSGISPNPLINIGVVIIYGYCLSLAAQRIKLPGAVGYVVAGILIRHESLGIIPSSFIENTLLIEQLSIMLLVSVMVRSLFYQRDLHSAARSLLRGCLNAVISIIMGGIVSFAITRDIHEALIFGMLSSLAGPLLVYGMTQDIGDDDSAGITATGSFLIAFIAWGLAAGLLHHTGMVNIRLLIMPFLLGLTSVVTGFVWAFVCERLFIMISRVNHILYPLAVLFLLYPLENTLGLDLIFLAVGVGLYNGLSSERELLYIETSPLTRIIVFVYLGSRIPIDRIVTMSRETWGFILLLFVLLAITRYVSGQISSLILRRPLSLRPRPDSLLLFGPLGMLVLSRFLPAFSLAFTHNISTYVFYSYLMLTTLLGICSYCVFYRHTG